MNLSEKKILFFSYFKNEFLKRKIEKFSKIKSIFFFVKKGWIFRESRQTISFVSDAERRWDQMRRWSESCRQEGKRDRTETKSWATRWEKVLENLRQEGKGMESRRTAEEKIRELVTKRWGWRAEGQEERDQRAGGQRKREAENWWPRREVQRVSNRLINQNQPVNR